MSTQERFSLKDHLFHEGKVVLLASQIKAVYPDFKEKVFVEEVVEGFKTRELMRRIECMAEQLHKQLPSNYRAALAIIKKALPPPCDPALTDDDFGDFIYAPYGHFVSMYGCEKVYLKESLEALKEITKRFSAEWALRNFLQQFPNETLSVLQRWTKDPHYHVRRLVSEGTRPNLPWGRKIALTYKETLPLLESLYSDKTRFVTRSVANHLNDIAKTEPQMVLRTLKRWQKSGTQTKVEMDFITKHALRTLVKQGHKEALALHGYHAKTISVDSFRIETPVVIIGESLEFSFVIKNTGGEPYDFLIDYSIDFLKANGTYGKKVHRIKTVSLQPGGTYSIRKKHPLRRMTTRTLYAGEHRLTLQINGESLQTSRFLLRPAL
jgi:3-methyladenine DNA glycosylase AlkC